MPTIDNAVLYEEAKKRADSIYDKPSAYKSGYIVKLYKDMGGTYTDDEKPRNLGRWFKEKWKDVGGKDYPVYRPTRRISSSTPLTPDEIDPENLKQQIRLKQKIKGKKNLPPFSMKGGASFKQIGEAALLLNTGMATRMFVFPPTADPQFGGQSIINLLNMIIHSGDREPRLGNIAGIEDLRWQDSKLAQKILDAIVATMSRPKQAEFRAVRPDVTKKYGKITALRDKLRGAEKAAVQAIYHGIQNNWRTLPPADILAQLDAGKQIVDDYTARMAAAWRQAQIAQQAPPPAQQAPPPAQQALPAPPAHPALPPPP